jgi:hypothetical protein
LGAWVALLALAWALGGCASSPQQASVAPAPPVASATASAATASASDPASASTRATTVASAASGAQPYDASQLDPRVTQATIGKTIAVSGYTTRVRPPVRVTNPIKQRLMREHHYPGPASKYELDHFIPLCVGGSSNLHNLWLEPIAEAHRKDVDEVRARDEVVRGVWTLAQGQQYIRDKWRIHYAH